MDSFNKKLIIYFLIIVASLTYILIAVHFTNNYTVKATTKPENTIHEQKVTEELLNTLNESNKVNDSINISSKVTMQPLSHFNSKPVAPTGYVKKEIVNTPTEHIKYIYYIPEEYESSDGIDNRCHISVSISELSEKEQEYTTIDEIVNERINELSIQNPDFEYTSKLFNFSGKDFITYVELSEGITTYYLPYILYGNSYTLEYSIYNKYLNQETSTLEKVLESVKFIYDDSGKDSN